MRARAAAVVGSMVVHATVVGWLVRDAGGSSTAAPPPPPPLPLAPQVVPPPLEVVLLDAPTTAAIPTATTATAGGVPSRSRGHRMASSSTGAHGPEVAGAPTRGPARRSPLMTMREAPAPTGVGGDFLADFLANSKPLPPPPDLPGERVGAELADVRARLRRAGRYDPAELSALRAEAVALAAERRAEELEPAGGGRYRTEKLTFRAKIAADGSVRLEDKPENMDAQDRLMLRHGIDPYARVKLAYLDRTRDQRAALGERHRTEQLARSAELVQRHIDRLWATTAELAARKQGLFELWDDCAETGSAALVEGGAVARARVITIIRGRLRGAAAYTTEELVRHNAARRSAAVFAPYE